MRRIHTFLHARITAAPRTAALAFVLGGAGAGAFYFVRNQFDKIFY